MRPQLHRQIWSFDSRYIRVEALDDAGQPLGYVYFVPRTHPLSAKRQLSPLSFIHEVCRVAVSLWFGAAAV